MTTINDEFEKSSKTPHDTAFRLAFQKKELAESFFRNYLPKEIARLIDFRTLKTVNKSFVDERFRQSHSDMVYEARMRGKTVFFYILFEHQSSPDRRMPFRILCYMVNFWKDYEAQHPDENSLPLVFPAVLYHGKPKWNSPLRLREMLEGYDSDFDWFVPDFAYRLYDLSTYDDDSLASGGNMALAVVLHLFKHIFDDLFGNLFKETADLAIEIEDQEMLSEILQWAVTYILHARNEDAGEIIESITEEAARIGDEKIRRVVMTAAEQLRQKGIEEGKLNIIGILLKQIKKRFGHTSHMLEKNLRQSNLDILNQFGEAIFDFKNLQDAEEWWEQYENGGNA